MNKKEAENLLKLSRNEIDRIDKDLIDLIHKRTSLAKDVITAKIALNMDIYDPNREKVIHEKMQKLAKEKNIDENIIIQLTNILTNLSKFEQQKFVDKLDKS
ncbi:MAG: chorismate mutase [Methanobrevibacter sp.]|nr:chorismate mutase [Methanobrevibacter sp.]